ncbi:MAG: hypothetical protein RBU37_27200, partial [Myxococcota bacterium]|nr:hypothetical protein [Myxococcota bacterium]
MRVRFEVLLSMALFALLAACGDGEINVGNDASETDAPDNSVQEWLTYSDLVGTNELLSIEKEREAIKKGLDLGKQSLADEMNASLASYGISASYLPQTLGTTGADGYVAPQSAGVCPFLEQEEPGEGLDCRAIADRASYGALSALPRVIQNNPLDETFNNERAQNEHWYNEGGLTGVSNESIISVRALDELGACERNTEPTTSAFEQGVEVGRELYIEKVNERFTELGMSMSYPDQVARIEVCQADLNFLAPAKNRAVESIDETISSRPLCEDYNARDADELALLRQVEDQYRSGLERGIIEEDSLASERIFRIVPCNVGDPLVLDVAGDGVKVLPLAQSEVQFDLFGNGELLKTAWIQADDALLALDKDGNGSIDNGRELFANFLGQVGYHEVPTGFEHLAIYDQAIHGGNGDGMISGADAIFSKLVLWQDSNVDGHSDPGELKSLPELGVQSIGLAYQRYQGEDSQLTQRGLFLRNA